MQLAAGTMLAGRYRLERKLGSGATGEVWAAKNMAVGTDVAAKVLLAAASAELVMRFRREAFLLARIRNDRVARVLDFATDDAFGMVLVMDLIDGEPLSDVLRKRRLSVEEAIDVAIDVLEGMVVLHRAHIVHRDMKPGNVILAGQGTERRKAVIVDFGLGKLMAAEDHDQSGITRPDMAVGTLEYMSPEQILNSRQVAGSADIYALGAMLFRAVTGGHMFGKLQTVALAQAKLTNPSPPLVTGRTDRTAVGFEGVVARAVMRNPEERYTRAEDMLVELLALREARRSDDHVETLQMHSRDPLPSAPPEPIHPAPPPTFATPPPRHFVAVLVALALGILMGAGLSTTMTLYFLERRTNAGSPGAPGGGPPPTAAPADSGANATDVPASTAR